MQENKSGCFFFLKTVYYIAQELRSSSTAVTELTMADSLDINVKHLEWYMDSVVCSAEVNKCINHANVLLLECLSC